MNRAPTFTDAPPSAPPLLGPRGGFALLDVLSGLRRAGGLAISLAFPLAVTVAGAGCAGGGGGGDEGGSCDNCTSGEVCVGNYDVKTDAAEERCEPAPADCDPLSCDDNTCRGALYDLCEDGWIGVGCSPYDPVVIVSCNPD